MPDPPTDSYWVVKPNGNNPHFPISLGDIPLLTLETSARSKPLNLANDLVSVSSVKFQCFQLTAQHMVSA